MRQSDTLASKRSFSVSESYRVNIVKSSSVPLFRNRSRTRLGFAICMFILLQETISLSDTNEEHRAHARPHGSGRWFKHDQIMSRNEYIKSVEHAHRPNSVKYRFARNPASVPKASYKVTATRIKFTNNAPVIPSTSSQHSNLVDHNSANSGGYSAQMHKLVVDRLPAVSGSIAGNSKIESSHVKQMARPAYDLWIEPQDSTNSVMINGLTPTKPNQNALHTIQKDLEQHILRELPAVNLDVARNLLPRPMARLSSIASRSENEHTARAARRATVRAMHQPMSAVAHDTHPQTRVEQRTAQIPTKPEAIDEESAPDTAGQQEDPPNSDHNEDQQDDDNDPRSGYSQDTNNGEDAAAESTMRKRRHHQKAPIYPPGDLDRLYSDALLVYVKDFNQFIE